MNHEKEIEELVSSHEKFDKVVYTPLNEALEELGRRWEDVDLRKSVSEYLGGDVPEAFADGFNVVTFRHICTPNYELHRFVSVADAFGWKPIFGEYLEDKFTSNNLNKYYLGKMGFHFGHGKKGGGKIKYQNIIDFNKANGHPISSIKTIWGQALVDFHKEIFTARFPQFADQKFFFDSSKWFKDHGGSATEYYKKLLALFVSHGVLFENFILSEKEEMDFTKKAFLPAFFEVWDKLGVKPLIVALAPTDIEGDEFWLHHPGHMIDHVGKNLNY